MPGISSAGRPRWQRIGVARGNVDLIELERCIDQALLDGHALAQFLEQIRNGMTSWFCSESVQDGFDGFLGRLLRREAGPIEERMVQVVAGAVL